MMALFSRSRRSEDCRRQNRSSRVQSSSSAVCHRRCTMGFPPEGARITCFEHQTQIYLTPRMSMHKPTPGRGTPTVVHVKRLCLTWDAIEQRLMT